MWEAEGGIQGDPQALEQTFAWLSFARRLVKGCEYLPQTTEAWIYRAMTRLMLRRLANEAH
ncbi:MAG: hypothetical protein DRH12_06520 [Deltaproteobacteria bacterium]|nr:MAG: hypothetical protein DRH12_06520 [Deltaproteobacteria bacterium]